MSSTLESQTHSTSKTTSRNIDLIQLYESIGDIVIERAHAGDKICVDIFTRSYHKAKELLS